LSTFSYIPKYEDDTHDLAIVVPDSNGTVIDRSLAAIPGDEEGMVAQPHSDPSLDDVPDWLFDRLSGRLVDDVKDQLDLLSDGVDNGPSGKLLGDGIEVIDAAFGIGGDDAIADGRESDLEPAPPIENRVMYLSRLLFVGSLNVVHRFVRIANLIERQRKLRLQLAPCSSRITSAME
jgi:hypothetical protein